MRIQTEFLWINIIGGFLVLGGYVYALITHPESRLDLWGGVPINLRNWIVFSMFLAAIGYSYSMYYLIFQGGLELKFFNGRLNYTVLRNLLILFLFASSFWIHSTFSYLESPSLIKWVIIQIELWITAISLLFIMIGLITANAEPQGMNYYFSVAGLAMISFHCLALDAVFWIYKFPKLH